MKYQAIREEEIKNKVAQDFFSTYDCSKIIGNIDFTVCPKAGQTEETESLLWAEAKKGCVDVHKSLVQLILTIGKARTFDKFLPPSLLGAFDAEKIAFLPYSEIQEIFYLNDFNWNVAPSNHETKEFKQIQAKVQASLEAQTLGFDFIRDEAELKAFIRDNFHLGQSDLNKIRIDKNNFIAVYNKWLQSVKPQIALNWEAARKQGIIDADLYLADLLSENNHTLKDKLFALLRSNHYELDRQIDEAGMFNSKKIYFKDNQVAHGQFWNRYQRPPEETYWDYIVERRDLLVPQDIRERRGSFFTPQIWVELSQQYLARHLGQDWQEEYFIWDCAAGTGNLLNGLSHKYRIWASTLDRQDVEVMRDRIENGANLLNQHVFQFDFLNDDFLPQSQGGKLPENLYKIIQDEEKRKKLIIYINPPYAEASTATTISGRGANKTGVSTKHKANAYFKPKIRAASNELFALFMAQVVDKIGACHLGLFSKLKFVQGSNFEYFKEYFKAKYLGGFVVPANSFDNVKGSFPIGFTLWNLGLPQQLDEVICDVYDKKAKFLGQKQFYGLLRESINIWIKQSDDKAEEPLAYMGNPAPDFQHNTQLYLSLKKGIEHFNFYEINRRNLFYAVVYFGVRLCMRATWLNDRDQFLKPYDSWKKDKLFQADCLAYVLFHGQNRVSCLEGSNHWIPFREEEVGAQAAFESHFMSDFILGKVERVEPNGLFKVEEAEPNFKGPVVFSMQAQALFEAGRKLWRYYQQQKGVEVNASFYDIRAYFQGRNKQGKMNNHSSDQVYLEHLAELRRASEVLAEAIKPKIYEHGFLETREGLI